MREIKFEVFDTHLKTMQKDAHLYHEFVRYLSDDRYIKRQYTGIKDKNGKEIYEGDVVNHDSSIWPCKIIYKRKIAQFMAKEIKKNGELGKVWQISEKKIISIVGNIYENPELLK